MLRSQNTCQYFSECHLGSDVFFVPEGEKNYAKKQNKNKLQGLGFSFESYNKTRNYNHQYSISVSVEVFKISPINPSRFKFTTSVISLGDYNGGGESDISEPSLSGGINLPMMDFGWVPTTGSVGSAGGGSSGDAGTGYHSMSSYATSDPLKMTQIANIEGMPAFRSENVSVEAARLYEYEDEFYTANQLYAQILMESALDELGISELLALLAIDFGTPAPNSTRGKVKGATKGTSNASKFFRSMFSKPLNKPLPSLTGFPFVGNGLRRMPARTLGTFMGRAVPVVGWGFLIYDLYNLNNALLEGQMKYGKILHEQRNRK